MNNKRIKTTLCLIVAMMVLSPACWGQYCLFSGLLESNIKANVCRKVKGDFLDMSRNVKSEKLQSFLRLSILGVNGAFESGGVSALIKHVRTHHKQYYQDVLLESTEYKQYILWLYNNKKKNKNNNKH